MLWRHFGSSCDSRVLIVRFHNIAFAHHVSNADDRPSSQGVDWRQRIKNMFARKYIVTADKWDKRARRRRLRLIGKWCGLSLFIIARRFCCTFLDLPETRRGRCTARNRNYYARRILFNFHFDSNWLGLCNALCFLSRAQRTASRRKCAPAKRTKISEYVTPTNYK